MNTRAAPLPLVIAGGATSAAPATDPETATVLSLVRSWSRALDAHDVAALASMYAPRVQFHGREVARDAVLAAKRRALGRGSVFHQSIVGNITVSPSDAGGHTVACTAVLSDAGP